MAEEIKETKAAKAKVKDKDAPKQKQRVIDAPATASWKISQEDFRRLARTGEFAQQEQKK